MTNNGGMKPNYISLDWIGESLDLVAVRDYLNFGGALGTGQTCTEDSHCASSSCNVALGLCQCQQCSGDNGVVCSGCVGGQRCVSSGNDKPNECTDTRERQSDNFYCGENYFDTLKTCNSSVKCPNGNEDCPSGQVCFAGIDCTLAPTKAPTDSPTESPSNKPSLMPSPNPTEGASEAPTITNTNFCGTDYFSTVGDCENATPCPEPFGDDACRPLNLTCFANVNCPKNPTSPKPTARPSASSVTATPPPVASTETTTPITSPTVNTLSPTPLPTTPPTNKESSAPTQTITRYCGTSYENAKETCTPESACPGGFECPQGLVW